MPMRPTFDVAQVLADAGFDIVHSSREEETFLFPDEAAWWQWAWSHGMRGLLEMLSPGDLDELRDRAFRELGALRTPDGLSLRQGASMVVARRPEGR